MTEKFEDNKPKTEEVTTALDELYPDTKEGDIVEYQGKKYESHYYPITRTKTEVTYGKTETGAPHRKEETRTARSTGHNWTELPEGYSGLSVENKSGE